MLTSAEHVPSELFHIYLRYKQGTRAIIAWLTKYRTRSNETLRTVSIRDLLGLAQIVRSKEIPMPEVVDFQFRETIAARTQLSKYFRNRRASDGEDVATTNHEYFTICLAKIYDDLCECCSPPRQDFDEARSSLAPSRLADGLSNPFAALSCAHSEQREGSKPLSATAQCPSCAQNTLPAVACSKNVPRLIDDQLSDACEIYREFEEINGLIRSANDVWERAARGEVPLVVATFITNAAFAAFEEIERRLQAICESLDLQVLCGKMQHLQADHDAPADMTSDTVPSTPAGIPLVALEASWEEMVSLRISWQLLLQLKHEQKAGPGDRARLTTQEASHILLRRGGDTTSADREGMAMLLQNIANHISTTRRLTSIVRLAPPLYADVGYFLTHSEDTNGLRCCFGLRMLLESYKSYLLAAPRPDGCPNCRLQALRLAQEAAPSVLAVLDDSTMPCRCRHTLAFHLENLHQDLEFFLKERAFDLYFQAPWVSGSHTLEMLDSLFYYGLRLFSYRHIIGGVCHVYHALRACTALEPVAMLEELCNVFNSVLFPGGRPARNFKASFIRYQGGRLHFRPHSSDHKSGNHDMIIPARSAKASAGMGLSKEANDSRFEHKKISLFYHVKEKGYHLDDSLWSKISTLAESAAMPPSSPTSPPSPPLDTSLTHRRTPSKFKSRFHPCQDQGQPRHRLSQLETAILADFTSTLPVGKINFFAVYLACIRIVSVISDAAHDDGDQGAKCLCFVDAVLGAADRYKANEHKLQPFGCKKLVETCRGAMKEELRGKEVGEFVWKSV